VFNQEEEKLIEWKNKYDELDIPMDKIDQALIEGFQRATQTPEKQLVKRNRKTWIWSSIAAAILFISLLTSIRVSPTFASYLSHVPGMDKIVDLIQDDKGLQSAFEHDYAQHIGAIDQQGDLKLTVESVIKDTEGMFIFYSIQTSNELEMKNIDIKKVKLTTKNGDEIEYDSLSYGNPLEGNMGLVEYYLRNPISEEEFVLDVEAMISGEKVTFNVPFTAKNQVIKPVIFQPNETVMIENQKITVKEVTINPLRVAIHLKMDDSNTKRLLSFEDIRLVDENGEEWSKITNGITASNISKDEVILYSQSNYFKEPKSLSIVLNKIQAIDKDHDYVLVDTAQKKIIEQPKGDLLSNVELVGRDLWFTLNTKEEFNFGIFGEATDAKGELIEETGGMMEGHEGGYHRIGIHLKDRQHENPIKIDLNFYPSWIEGEARVELK